MTKEIATKPEPLNWAILKDQSNVLIKTGFLPPSVRTAEQVIAITLTGRELGIGMMESIRGINVIQGKPSVSPQLMLALARRTGQLESFALHAPGKPGTPPDSTGAECRIKRVREPEHITVFGPAEARALGLLEKDNYKKQAPVMFGWRAVAANLRMTFPDAISGLYTPDEMGADVTISDSGEMQVVDAAPASPTIQMPKEKKPATERSATDRPAVTSAILISDDQRRMLFAKARAAYGEAYETKLRQLLSTRYGSDTTKLALDQFEDVSEWLDQLAVEHAPAQA